MRILILFGACAGLLLAGCSNSKFSPATPVVEAASQGSSNTLPAPLAPSSAPEAVGGPCTKTVEVPGCPATAPVCASYEAIFYDSPNGCDPKTAGSYIIYSFNGANETYQGLNGAGDLTATPEVIGGADSAYHCTYVGSGVSDPFHNVPNGQCFNSSAAGYGGSNTYTQVVLGSGCSYQASEPGTIQSDGSCR